MSNESPNPLNEYSEEFEQDLAKVEQALEQLRQRYAEVIEARRQQMELQESLHAIEQAWQNNPTAELEAQLQEVKAQLQDLQVTLESSLLSNDDLKRLFWAGLRDGLLGEVFWQIVRYGGLGVIVGWILKSCAG